MTLATSVIDKFLFASSSDATTNADLTGGTGSYYFAAGVSSVDYGYGCGGALGAVDPINNVNIYRHVSDADSTDWGDLTIAAGAHATVMCQGGE